MNGDDGFCGQCGRGRADDDHGACEQRAALEPPRYCAACARRMVVQVLPQAWTARCPVHGLVGIK